jgi:hypothetical protein
MLYAAGGTAGFIAPLKPGRSNRWRAFVAVMPNNRASLPDIAVHIVKPPRLRLEAVNQNCHLGLLQKICARHCCS